MTCLPKNLHYLTIMKSTIYRYAWDAPRDHAAPFRVYSHGINEKMPKGIYKHPATDPDWLFIYFHDPVEIDISKTQKHVKAGSFLIRAPGSSLHYGNADTTWIHSWLQCTGTVIPKILKENRFAPRQPIYMSKPILVERYLMRIFTEVSAHHKPDQRLLQNIFHNWIIEMARVVRHMNSDLPPAPEALEATKRHIDLHILEKLSLTQLARMSHLSISHFSTLFRRYYNASPIDYQIHRRMEYARHLLEIPNLSITEVAERTGYPDLYLFSRMFKKRFGESPSTYRKRD